MDTATSMAEESRDRLTATRVTGGKHELDSLSYAVDVARIDVSCVPSGSPLDRHRSMEEDGNSTDAMADAFSCSLADIAAAGRREHQSCSSERNNSAAAVSATQTSSGEDRDSSGDGRKPSSSTACDDHLEQSKLQPALHDEHFLRPDGVERPHYHRHGYLRRSASHTTATFEHALVVAHQPFTGSIDHLAYSSSGGDTERVVGEAAASASSLLRPLREPGVHTIRQTFDKFGKRSTRRSTRWDESNGDDDDESSAVRAHKRTKRGIDRQPLAAANADSDRRRSAWSKKGAIMDSGDSLEDDSGAWSGSEGGYSASHSSSENFANCGSPHAFDDSDDSGADCERTKGQSSCGPMRLMITHERRSSSDIADRSSSRSFKASNNRSESMSQSCFTLAGDDDRSCFVKPPSRKRQTRGQSWLGLTDLTSRNDRTEKRVRPEELKRSPGRVLSPGRVFKMAVQVLDGKPPIMALGCDVMAHVLTFLEPPGVLDFLTMPLSNDWQARFTGQPELWRVLCLLEPFKAQVDDEEDSDSYGSDSDDASFVSTAKKLSQFRLRYTSYVRCMRCLERIKDDSVSGRPLSVVDHAAMLSAGVSTYKVGANQHLQQFLSRARGSASTANESPDGISTKERFASNTAVATATCTNEAVTDTAFASNKQQKIKFGHSKLTQRLLGPPRSGELNAMELPWSYGIYSIVNWMVAFSDVEGIQTMCLRVLPFLLENEQQRLTAQRAGLTDIVLRGMVLYPESAVLHTAAFHTIVLLARPLGGQEGLLFHTSMVNSSGIFSSTDADEASSGRQSGIAVLLDSMRRFQSDEVLQSMACWSLVNIALAPAQKEVLVKLGGIEVISKSMVEHRYNAEVQFRALFALINLVIPSVAGPSEESNQDLDGFSSETEMLDEMVDQIVNLVVASMKNFCSDEAILNRACLVLHNLSLTPGYHYSMLWTPNCFQMLEWCLGNYRTDQVLQQSASGTLHRLQTTLSSDEALRLRFAASIQDQQKQSLEQAHREAVRLHKQQEGRAAESRSVSDGA